MAQYEVTLPDLGEDIEEATVSFWQVEEGDTVNQDDDLLEVVTDKANLNVPSPVGGKVIKLLAEEGSKIKVGQKIALIDTE